LRKQYDWNPFSEIEKRRRRGEIDLVEGRSFVVRRYPKAESWRQTRLKVAAGITSISIG
jgi:hypothetical protein